MLGKPLIKFGTPIGSWNGQADRLLTTPEEFARGLRRVGQPLYAVEHGEAFGLADGGSVEMGLEMGRDPRVHGLPLLAVSPACRPQNFGSASFAADHGVRFCYLAGAMANGIGSVELVEANGPVCWRSSERRAWGRPQWRMPSTGSPRAWVISPGAST